MSPCGAVHAHVERALVAVAEATFGPVQLRRRHAEVEQGSGQLLDSCVVDHLAETVEAAVHGRDAVAEAVQPSPRGGERLLVAIEAEHGELRAAVEHRLGVAATAERGVEQRPGRDRGEDVDDLVDHHRLVDEVAARHHVAANSALPRSATSR